MHFRGTVNEPATVTVAGNAANVDAAGNFDGLANVNVGTNTVAVVATDASGNARTNSYQVNVPSGASTTLLYDLNGNLTNDGSKTYEWDVANRLVAVNYTGTTNRSEFTYDGLSRLAKIVEKTGGSVTSTRKFVSCGMEQCEFRDATDAVTLRVYPQGQYSGTTAYFFSRDHLGSIREMSKSNGTVVARYDYDPYGRSTTVIGTTPTDYNFTGLYRHSTSNLDLAGYRAYDPDLGRWLSRDPIGETGGINLYQYVQNNGVNLTDPLGLRPLTDCEKEALSPYIPQIDLDSADVHTGKMWLLGKGIEGITVNNDIYLRPGYDPATVGGLALLGHELVHVGQYRKGMTVTEYLWASRHGYYNNPYEQAAYGKQAEIKKTLSKDKCCSK